MSLASFIENNLAGSAPARKLKTHLANFEARLVPIADCPRVRISLLRRTFKHGLENGRRFGLPATLPRAIALVDLSGEKALLTSDSPTMLMAAVVTGFSAFHDRERHLRELCTLETWGTEHGMSFLCIAVLPWQAGIGHVAFEVRTFKEQDGKILDGQKLVCSYLMGVRDGSTTRSPEGAPVGGKEVKALAEAVSAVSVDGAEAAPVEEDKKVTVLQETARRLMTQRQELMQEIEVQKEKENERVSKAVARKEAIALEKHVQATRLRNACDEKLKASDAAVREALKDKIDADKATAEAKRALAETSLRLKECEEGAARQKKAASTASAASARLVSELRAQLSELQKAPPPPPPARDIHKEQLQEQVADLNRKAADNVDTIQKLAEVIDRTEGEQKQAVKEAEAFKVSLAKARDGKRRAEVARRETEARLADADAAAEAARGQLLEEKASSLSRLEGLRLELEKERSRAEIAEKARPEASTGPTTRVIQTQTSCMGTGTSTVASTQTDQMEEVLPTSPAEIAKAAHRALNRLCEVSQLPQSVYKPSFKAHTFVPTFRPPTEYSDC